MSIGYSIRFSQDKRMGHWVGRETRWVGMVVVKETSQAEET